MERASARDLVVGADALQHGFIYGSREGSLSGNIDIVQSLPVRTSRRQWLTLFHLRRLKGEESGLEVLQPRELSEEMSPSMQ